MGKFLQLIIMVLMVENALSLIRNFLGLNYGNFTSYYSCPFGDQLPLQSQTLCYISFLPHILDTIIELI